MEVAINSPVTPPAIPRGPKKITFLTIIFFCLYKKKLEKELIVFENYVAAIAEWIGTPINNILGILMRPPPQLRYL